MTGMQEGFKWAADCPYGAGSRQWARENNSLCSLRGGQVVEETSLSYMFLKASAECLNNEKPSKLTSIKLWSHSKAPAAIVEPETHGAGVRLLLT